MLSPSLRMRKKIEYPPPLPGGLVWFQTVCKSYQQTTHDTSRQGVKRCICIYLKRSKLCDTQWGNGFQFVKKQGM